jgi:transcriptional regulator with XRE-family HTH domain
VGKKKYTELGQYIVALTEAQNLSLRQASVKSDLDPTTIARILQRDGTSVPTPETLAKIADGLDGDFYRMMTLAGHLPGDQGGIDIEDAELYAKFQRLQTLVQEVAEKDPEAARRLMGMIITPFEVMLALESPEVEEVAVSEQKEMV